MRTLLVALMALSCCATTLADVENVGDPYPGGSWNQQFRSKWPGQDFDLLSFKMTSNDTFAAPVITSMADGSWQELYADSPTAPTLATWGGNLRDGDAWLNYTAHFEDPRSEPLTFEIAFFRGATFIGSDRAHWTGSSWQFSAGTWQPTLDDVLTPPIPAPAAALLGLIGMAGVRAVRRRVA